MAKDWKVLDTEYIIRRPWLTARRDKIELPDGRIIPEYYVLEYPTWINVIAITKEGKMVMIRQHRHALNVDKYEICAGVMEPKDESPMVAAQRELLEETGFGGGHWEQFSVLAPNPSSMNNLTYTFLARDVEKISNQHLDATEDLTYELLDPEEVFQLLQQDEIVQALMAAPLWKYFYSLK